MRFSAVLRTTVLILAIVGTSAAALSAIAETPAVKPTPGRSATDKASELNVQFRQLKAAKSPHAAAPIVSRIWEFWMRSGDPAIDQLMVHAVTAMELRQFDYALTQLNKIIEIAPDYAEGWNKRATLLYMMNEYDRSLLDIVETLKREPRHFGALAGRGMIHVARKNWHKALNAYRAALAVNPFIHGGSYLIPELEKMVKGQEI